MISDNQATALTVFHASAIPYGDGYLYTGRLNGQDVILAPRTAEAPSLEGAATVAGDFLAYPATYANMLAWETRLAPQPRLVALNQSGYGRGFGAGNRIVLAQADVPGLGYPGTFGGWDGIYAAMTRSATPFWFIQQSIVRELIPEGVDPAAYPGIGHTGGYGPREFLRAGLFAFASQGGYGQDGLPIGADADHAIVVGHDEGSLQRSLAFNKLAIREAQDYTKFTVDTSQLFGFPTNLTEAEQQRLLSAFSGRRFTVPNILAGRPSYEYQYDRGEILRLGQRYWRACSVHADLYREVAALRGARPFDYELSLDETPSFTPPRDLLFYLVTLEEVLGVPRGAVASAGPNLGYAKRHDYEGELPWLRQHVSECASILGHRGAMLSVHSADGVSAWTGKGSGVDEVFRETTGGAVELKVADVYQEVLWETFEASSASAEREIFAEAWRRTYEAAGQLAAVYRDVLAAQSAGEAQAFLASAAGQRRVAEQQGEGALRLAQAAISYGLPVFELAADLLSTTDPGEPSARAPLFRRFMFLTYRGLRPTIFATLDRAGWARLATALEEATMVRLRAMRWLADGEQ
ncbi:MAG: tagaturonate epimerase family protein [Anaerolineae bacterium]